MNFFNFYEKLFRRNKFCSPCFDLLLLSNICIQFFIDIHSESKTPKKSQFDLNRFVFFSTNFYQHLFVSFSLLTLSLNSVFSIILDANANKKTSLMNYEKNTILPLSQHHLFVICTDFQNCFYLTRTIFFVRIYRRTRFKINI